MDKNRVIGKDNKMLWELPEDMEQFRKLTKNKIVIMGRKTHESIGHSLACRTNIVISRQRDYHKKTGDCVVVRSIDAALSWGVNQCDVYVIGGAEIYRQVIKRADKLYVTKIDHVYEGDAYFPEINEEVWKLVECKPGHKAGNCECDFPCDFSYNYSFMVYERK